jgi:opacity protein-like surface antigen
MKAPGLRLTLLVCFFAAIFATTAYAQGGYPPPYPPPPPGAYPPPNYPPPRNPPPAYPQDDRYQSFGPQYTFSLFVGTRFGGNIAVNTPNVDSLHLDTSLNGGFNFGVRLVPHLFAEFMWNRQSTTLSAHDMPINQMVPLTNHAHLDMYQASLLYELWSRGPLRPFIVGGFGLTHFDSHGILSFDNRLSYNLGGGVKYLVAPHTALRAELRWSPSRTTTSTTTFCDPFLGCFVTPVNNHAQQGQANLGIEFRF